MTDKALRTEDIVGIFAAIVLHVLLIAVLAKQWTEQEDPPVPERMTVSFAEDVGMSSTAPEPVAESRASEAPMLSDAPAPLPPITSSEPQAAPVQRNSLPPPPRTRPAPRPRPQPRGTPRPRPDEVGDRRRPDRPRSATRPRSRPQPAATRSGGSRVGDNFLEGSGSSSSSSETRMPASQIGASARASLVQAIAREIKPHWQPPNGPEVEQIVSVLRFRLNEDGSLAGRPSLVRQTGVNATNRAQAERHAEQAIRAVQLAAPFDLPPQYYNAWRNISAFSFDWKLSQ